MGNKITEKYFEQEDFSQREQEVLETVCAELGFTPTEEIFRGVIYEPDKVGSLIYTGEWQSDAGVVPAVLKLQGLEPDVDEIDILGAFAAQSESARVRLPKLYAGKHWDASRGYGYLLLEYVDAPQIYAHPYATDAQITAFCEFYQEYRSNAVKRAFVDPEIDVNVTPQYAADRMRHWATIAESQGNVSAQDLWLVDEYIKALEQAELDMPMEFQHAHLTADDIFDMGDGSDGREYVLMSNLFWGWRPQWYDTTFHLWAGVKAIRDTAIQFEHVLAYIEKWLAAYKEIPLIAEDTEFERKFWLLMAGRSLGAILLDAHNQDYTLEGATEAEQEEYRKHHTAHVVALFRQLLSHAIERVK